MELRAIADKPLTGHGYGNALGSYGDARKALSLPVNDRNMSMRDLHNKARKFYDEHSEDY